MQLLSRAKTMKQCLRHTTRTHTSTRGDKHGESQGGERVPADVEETRRARGVFHLDLPKLRIDAFVGTPRVGCAIGDLRADATLHDKATSKKNDGTTHYTHQGGYAGVRP